ncbi:MAG TPA: glycosyltransferase family 39 protein, partial [Acidimicrobiales bacterium]|nr:glycosyltransferase family 39 protein [Acidimicrobiales bacterium]
MTDVTPAPGTAAPVAVMDPEVVLDAAPAFDDGAAPDAGPLGPASNWTPRRGPVRRFFRGKESDAPWVRPALLVLLAATAVLYLWDLGASGWANSFYSAAVQAGTKSWKAFFFGSSDSSNFITVDKPPFFLWPMEISARIFGVNSWSILVPQALEGVATVGLVYLAVRRWFSAQAALLGGAVVALTPVAAMMFRFNNPDAMLALLLTGATYATVRALERAQTKWLVLAGALVGLGFITKMMQAFIIIPALALVYLLAAPTGWWRRVWQVVVMGVATLVAAGWWVAIVALTPAADRPYVGGSQDNSILNLIFGYNGFGRITGNETGSVGGSPAGGSMWGPTGFTRLFNTDFGNMMSWLLPGALIMGVFVLVLSIRARRTDRERAAVLLWGGSLVCTGLVISLAQGIIHPYYTVALAPPLGALVGITTMGLWRRRGSWAGRIGLAAGLGATVVWSYVLLGRTSDWFPALRPFVAVVGTLGIVAILLLPLLRSVPPVAVALVATLGLSAALAAPLFSTVATAATPHSGAIPTVTPTPAGGGFGGGFPGGGFRRAFGGSFPAGGL